MLRKFLLITVFLFSLPKGKLLAQTVDKRAYKTPVFLKKTPQALSAYLTANLTNDSLKVVNIYTWLIHNIRYDVKTYFDKTATWVSSRRVIKKRKGVCEHYARLFQELCRYNGIKSTYIAGYVRGSDYQPDDQRYFAEHAWNTVKINGKWYLLDATWDSGYLGFRKKSFWRGVLTLFAKPRISDRYKFVRAPDYKYFLSNPKKFVLSHLPLEPKWQLLPDPVTIKVFEAGQKAIKQHLLFAARKPLPGNDELEKYLDFPRAYQHLKTAESAQAFNPKNHQVMAYACYNYAVDLSEDLQGKGNTALASETFMYLKRAIKQGRLYQKDNSTIYRKNADKLNTFARKTVQRDQQQLRKNAYREKNIARRMTSLHKQEQKLKTNITSLKKLSPKSQANTKKYAETKVDTIALWRDTLATKQQVLRQHQKAVLKQWRQISRINRALPDPLQTIAAFISRDYSLRIIRPYLEQKDSLILKRRRLYKTLQTKRGLYRRKKSELAAWLAGTGLMYIRKDPITRPLLASIYNLRLNALKQEEKFLQGLMFFNENTLLTILSENRLLEQEKSFAKDKLKEKRQMNKAMYQNIKQRTNRLIDAAIDARISLKHFIHRVRKSKTQK